jgi:hypothetical protein
MVDINDFLKRAKAGGILSIGEKLALQLTKTDYEAFFRNANVPVIVLPNGRECPMVKYITADQDFLINFIEPSARIKVEYLFRDLVDRYLEKGELPPVIVRHRELQTKMLAEDNAEIGRLMFERGMRL